MPTETDRAVTTRDLTEAECWAHLVEQDLGRLAVVRKGQPEIFPIGYRVAPGGLLIRTGPGAKLFSILIDDRVAFEIDDRHADHAWSVVVTGWAEELDPEHESSREPLVSRFAGPDAHAVVRITPARVTGRELRLG